MKILLVVLDSVRYDGAMAHEGLLGLRDWQVLPCGSNAPYTPSSLTTVATGLYPISHRFWDFPVSKNSQPHSRYYFFDWGVPAAWYSTRATSTYMWPEDSNVGSMENAIKFLNKHDDCILAVHAWETHIPYAHKESIDVSISNMKDMTTLDDRLGYMNNGLDAALAKLAPLLDSVPSDTVVFITSDHGEALGEPNPFVDQVVDWKGAEDRWMHQHCFAEEMLVPMLIDGYKSEREFVRLVDLAPTFAEILGVDPEVDFDGKPMSTLFYSVGWSVCRWHYYGDSEWMEQGVLCWDKREKKVVSATLRRGFNEIVIGGDGDFRTVLDGMPVFPKDAFRGFHDVYGNPFDIQFDGVFEGYTAEEERAITKKLQALGYLK